MSPRLSQDTERRIAALFPPSSRAEVSELLIVQCGNNLPFCDGDDEFQLERIRFSALKLSAGNIGKLRDAIKLAKTDWRDLLVAAGFADDPAAHKRWIPPPSGLTPD
ncbi:MAG: hypothetical protein AUI02_00910 [Acidobacteria bacterium 13_2_20CM_2_57_12]|nr:MAG: hypothetical protein AUI02_00910 [Acidobacteria bacterium 13_2_20CM_2_57_12]